MQKKKEGLTPPVLKKEQRRGEDMKPCGQGKTSLPAAEPRVECQRSYFVVASPT
jgi:hypothetical protein